MYTEARVISRSVCDGLMLNVLEEQSSTLCPKHSSVVPGYLVEDRFIRSGETHPKVTYTDIRLQ